MKDLEKDIMYFINLVFTNIQNAKKSKDKEKAVFYNLNIKLDGSEIIFYNADNEHTYTVFRKDIEKYKFKHSLTQYLALRYIDNLTKYSNKEITFEELAEIREETKTIVKDILVQKDNIIEQLKLLRQNRNIPEVQEYIDKICNDEVCTEYVRYLIDKYYYNKKKLIKPKKTGLECWGKMILV